MAEVWAPPRALRPIERRVLRLQAEGYDHAEIGRRFRKSPDMIGRIVSLSSVARRRGPSIVATHALRPIERRVLHWLDAGIDHAEIAYRFRRHPAHIARVEAFARRKLRDAAGRRPD